MRPALLHEYNYLSPEGGECYNLPGSVVMQHLRMEQLKPDDPKFLYRYPSGDNGWTWKKPPWADSMLYGLERLNGISASDSLRRTVYWCEGEKDADSIAALGLPWAVAVSHHGGAGKATPAQVGYLSGWLGSVVVCADIDPAGAACALGRYDRLRKIGIRKEQLRIVKPAGPNIKNRDVTDHLNDRYTLDALVDVDVPTLRARVGRMSPAERRDGSGWRKTGDPEVDNYDISTWAPIVEPPHAGGESSSRRPALPSSKPGGRVPEREARSPLPGRPATRATRSQKDTTMRDRTSETR
jgi:hypothetical protein